MAMADTLETVLLERRGAELRVVINRPDRMNAWDAALSADLMTALEAASAEDVRAVTITGAGRAFCSGADLRAGFDTREDTGTPDFEKALHARYHPVLNGIRRLDKPVLAAVNGGAAGVGVSLALACDLVVARESAYFLLAFVNIGLVPDGGSSAMIPARIGFTRASELALLGERLPAPTALEWGLINRVAADDAFESEVDSLAQRLAEGPTKAYAGAKRQLNEWLFGGMDEQLSLEARLQSDMGVTADFAEGVGAFLEKRPARFTGR
jgi:2-(1,2-epoxy-1,2-dihydrophenyl)acetyl-CoA isomerase